MMPPSVVFSTGTTPKSALPRCDLLEHARDGADRHRARRQAELLLDRHVRKRPFGAEVGDAHALLQRQAGAEDLLEHRADGLGRERARGWRPTADRRSGARATARRTAPPARVFSSATLPTSPARWLSSRQDLVVGAVDLGAQLGELGSRRPAAGILGHRPGAYYTGRMRLATLRDGTRDGALVVVGRDGDRCARAARDRADAAGGAGRLGARRARAGGAGRQAGRGRPGDGEPLDVARLAPPLPRAYEWIDGSAFLDHVAACARRAAPRRPPTLETDPLVYQGGSGVLLGPRDDIPLRRSRAGGSTSRARSP